MRKPVVLFGATVLAALVYYAFIAASVLAVMSLAVPSASSTSLQFAAFGWVIAEALTIGLPFVALASIAFWWPSMLPRYIWLAPLAVVVVPIVASLALNLLTQGTLTSDLGIGGALIPELSIALDVLAVLLGSALVIVAQSHPAPSQARLHASAAGTHR